MKPLDQTFVSFDATAIAYRVWGKPTSKTAMICCSGIACDDIYWTHLAPHLARQRLVVTWDYPHHGRSGPAGDPAEITIPSLTKHALALGDYLEMPQSVFAGHSMGVQVALETVRLSPGRVAGLVLIAGPYGRTVGSLYRTSAGAYLLSLLESAQRASPEVFAMLWRFMADGRIADPMGRLGGLIGRVPPAEMARYFEHLKKLDPARLLEMFRAGQEHSGEDLLESIQVPVLIIHGTADVMTPLALAEEMERRIPGARLVKVKGGAHTLPLEEPSLINDEVSRFMRKVDGLMRDANSPKSTGWSETSKSRRPRAKEAGGTG